MYWYEKDYIMRLIHGISRALAYLYFGKKMEDEEELYTVMGEQCRENNDYLRRMVDSGQINAAEDRLFDLLENTVWDIEQKTMLIISFYDYVNGKKDEFLYQASFSRDEIYSGLKDALALIGREIPDYLRIREAEGD
ncbi:MAG: hypothetical protein J6U01_04470 [Clostridia bacterium]|nr:hypothetical protein [Clostridia bacterium]